MRGDVISVLSLEGRYHILSRVSIVNDDITEHIVFMSPCYRPDKGISM